EWALQKLVELGVDRIVPLLTDRGVVSWPPDRSQRQTDRWRTIGRQAAMQSRRLWLPVVEPVRRPAELVAAGGLTGGSAVEPGSAGGGGAPAGESDGRSPAGGLAGGSAVEPGSAGGGGAPAGEPDGRSAAGAVALAEPGGRAPGLDHPTVLIGPEGGWSDAELALRAPRVALGTEILRTETAAVAAGTLLTALRAGLVAEGRQPPPAG
ncbi:MAG: RsmE family RNA methyltransferase, partial [Acidimicrobiales bacterium]